MSANWLDKSIAWIAPRTALDRAKARAQFNAHVRAYDGAARGRHTDGWKATGSSADAEIAMAGTALRDRARDLRRNNPHATKGVAAWVTNLVGEGIMPRADTGDDALNKRVMEAFAVWSKACDADGQLDFYGLQTLAVATMIESGEALLRRRQRLASDGLAVPVQIQVLEPDLLDSTRNGPSANGNTMVQGVEFDRIGRRAAYWLFAQHPGNVTLAVGARLNSAPVPASEVIHLYEKVRTQCRGVTWLAPVIRELRDHADYRMAERIRKKVEASMVAIVIGNDDQDFGINPKGDVQASGQPGVVDANGNAIESISPGLIAYARGGKDIKFNSPAVTGGFGEYDTTSLRAIAAGLRLPYELLTGDLSQINFSSIRAGLLEFRRLVSALQWQLIIPTVCDTLWRWFCEAAYLQGLIPRQDIPVQWAPPAFNWVDPYKDVLSDILAMRAGIKTPQDVVAATGRSMAEVIAEFKAWNDLLDKNDLTFDSDPRRTTLKGLMQKTVLAGQDGQDGTDGQNAGP